MSQIEQKILDKDLLSVQNVRLLLANAKKAHVALSHLSQQQIDAIIKAMADAAYQNAEKLARMASEETGFGRWQDKVIKNIFASKVVYEAIQDQKTVGILRDDPATQIIDIGVAVGVIAGLVPSTNPTSTVIYKALIAIKGGNPIIFSPHPNAQNCIAATVRIITEAARQAGCPEGAISVMEYPTLQGTSELMRHHDTKLILATGGSAMVKAAYSSGTPAIGVGAGNGPAYIDRTANVPLAIQRIMDSKTFDNGTICASEQSIIIEKQMEATVLDELRRQGCYILNELEAKKLEKFILTPNGGMNPQIVGKPMHKLSELAGLESVPDSARMLIARETKVGPKVPYSREKLGLILTLYVEDTIDAVLEKSIKILEHEGSGHTFSIHAEDKEIVKRFALAVPASRVLVNTPSALGGIGATTKLFPALTLGCGAVGGSSSSNNIGPLDLINIKRVAYGTQELSDIKASIPECLDEHCNDYHFGSTHSSNQATGNGLNISPDQVAGIIRQIMQEISK